MPLPKTRPHRLGAFARRPVTALTTLALLIQAVAPAYAQIVADTGAARANQARFDTAANGVPIVNIVAPNAAGMSHNKYTTFNVDTKGVVLNNALALGTSQLGGLVLGNPNLKTSGAASLILNEVTGTNRSMLSGYLEVNGAPAAVIVANPNGITCGGCGFINTPRATLTTGRPGIDPTTGALRSLAVDGGDILIEGAGLDATRAQRFELVTRAIQLNAALQARDVLVSGGAQDFDYASAAATARASSGPPPINFYLDSTALGGMYADRIRIVGNEHGLGIRAPENMAASAGDMTLLADGRLILKNASASGTISAQSTSDGIEVAGLMYSDQAVTLTAPGAIAIGDKAVAGTLGQLAITGGSLALGDGVIAAGLKSDGTLSAGAGSATLTIAGATTIATGGLLNGGGALKLMAGSIDNAGSLQADTSIEATSTGAFNNSGAIASTGTATLRSASFANAGSVAAASNLAVASTVSLISAGTLRTNGILTLTSDTLTLGDVTAGGDLVLSGGNLTENGTLSSGGNAALTLARTAAIGAPANLAAVGNLTLSAPLLDNGGTLVANGTVTLTDGGTAASQVTNRTGGRIASGGPLTIGFGNVSNGGLITSSADAVLSGGILNSTGQITATGTLTSRFASFTNSGAFAGNDVTLTIGDALTNATAGTIQAARALTLTAGNATNRGQFASAGSLSFALSTLDNDAGHIDAQNDVLVEGIVAGSVATRITNGSGEIGSVAGGLSLRAATITTSGTLAAAQTVALVADRSFTNDGGGRVEAGTNLAISAGDTIDGSGIYRANGTATLSSAALSIADFASGGAATFSGTTFVNHGVLASNASIGLTFTDAVTNGAGTGLQAGDALAITAPTIENGGTLFARNAILLRGATADRVGILNNKAGGRIAGGNIGASFASWSNAGTVTSAGGIILAGGTLDNSSEISAGGDFSFALDGLTNSGNLTGGSLIGAVNGDIGNAGSGVIQATTGLGLQARAVTNFGLIAAGGTLVLATNALINDHALLIARGDVGIEGLTAGSRANSVRNLSGTIESTEGNIAILTADLENIGDGTVSHQTAEARYFFKTNTRPPSFLPRRYDYITPAGYFQLYDEGRTHEYAWVPSPAKLAQILAENNITAEQLTPEILDRYVPTSVETFDLSEWEIVIPDESGRAPRGSYVYSRDEQDIITHPNTPGQILTDHGNIAIDAGLLHNFQSTISAVGDIALTGGSVLNEGTTLGRAYSLGLSFFNDTTRALGWDRGAGGYTNWFLRGQPGPRLVFANSAGTIPSTITATGAISGNLAGTFANVGTPATDPSTLSFANTSSTIVTITPASGATAPASNGTSTVATGATSVSGTMGSVTTDANINQSQLKAFAPALDSSHFVIETRLPFIDVANFFGSDYFFTRLGLRPDNQVKALGDAYFDTTVVREQILDLTGERFLDPNIASDTEQMRILIEHGASESKRLHLTPGVSLTNEQQGELTSDVVIYVEKIFNGQSVIVPQLYLSTASRKGIGDYAARVSSGAGNVLIVAQSILNRSGSITTNGDLRLKSGTIVDVGGLLKGNSVILEASDHIQFITEITQTGDKVNQNGAMIGKQTELIAGSLVVTAPEFQSLGGQIKVSGDAKFDTRDFELTPVEVEMSQRYKGKSSAYETYQRTLIAPQVTVGGKLDIHASNAALIRAATLNVGKDIKISAGELLIDAGSNESSGSSQNRKSGFTKSHSSSEYLTITQVPTIIRSGGDITIETTVGDTTIRASTFEANKIFIDAAGKINLQSAANRLYKHDTREGHSFVWASSSDKGIDQSLVVETQLKAPGGVGLAAGNGIVIEIPATGDLDQSIATLSQAPGLAWLKDLTSRPDVHLDVVRNSYREWNEHTAGLSGPAATVLAIAIAIATDGVGAPAAFGGSAAANAVFHAALSSLVTQASIAAINNKGNIGAVLQSLTSSTYARSLATAIATAGIVGVASDQGLLSRDPRGFIARLKSETFAAATNATLQTTFEGSKFGETLFSSLINAGVSVSTASAQSYIGEIAAELDVSEGSVQKVLAHSLVGGLSSKLRGGSFQTGAFAGAASEIAASSLDTSLADPKDRIAFAGLIGGVAALAAGGNQIDVSLAASISSSAQRYNREMHKDEALVLAKLKAGASSEKRARLEDAACFLIRCANGVPDNDPGKADLLAQQQRGATFTEEQGQLVGASPPGSDLWRYKGATIPELHLAGYNITPDMKISDISVDDYVRSHDELLTRVGGGAKLLIGADTVVGGVALAGGGCVGSAGTACVLAVAGGGLFVVGGYELAADGSRQLLGAYIPSESQRVRESFDTNSTLPEYHPALDLAEDAGLLTLYATVRIGSVIGASGSRVRLGTLSPVTASEELADGEFSNSALKARQIELGTDPGRGYIKSEGAAGVRIEQALGRQINRSSDVAIDFVDTGDLGAISLKGPIPEKGSLEGLGRAAIKDAMKNTATQTLIVDTTGLTGEQFETLRTVIQSGTIGTVKRILYIR